MTPVVPVPDRNRRGALQMVAAMGLFVFNDVLVKHVSGHLPSGVILCIRGLFATATALAIVWHARKPQPWRELSRPIVGWRIALEFGAALCSVAALTRLPVVTVSAIMMTAPLMIVALSLVHTPAGRATERLVLCVVGLTGACLVLQPAWSSPSSGWWAAVMLAVILAARDLLTRRIPDTVSSEQLTLVITLAVTLGGAMLALRQGWRSLVPGDMMALAGAAYATTAGNLLLIRACRQTDLAVVALYRYTIVLWSLLAGMLGWQHRPDALSLVGGLLIVLAGWAALRRPHNAPP